MSCHSFAKLFFWVVLAINLYPWQLFSQEKGSVDSDVATVTLKQCQSQDIDSVFQKEPGLSLEWTVNGIFLDSKKNLIKFLSPLFAEAKNWSQDNQCDIILALFDIGYYSDLVNTRTPDGHIKIVIYVEPVTSVRHVQVDTQSWIVDRLLQPFFADDILSCLLYTSPSPRDATLSRMPSSA